MTARNNSILLLVAVIIFIALLAKMVQLQLLEGKKYQRLALDNAAKNIPAAAPRGVIFDRRHRVLVANRPIFYVEILPQLLSQDEKKRQTILSKLDGLLGERFESTFSANQPVMVRDNISHQAVIKVEENHRALDGIVTGSRPVRYYPFGSAGAHLLGFVDEIEAAELFARQDEGYRRGDIVGKDGVEKYYDALIRGVDGGKRIEVDVRGEPLRILSSIDPLPGADVELTIDADFQAAAEKALAYYSGAVVIMDIKNGNILALASHPNYDPNLFIGHLEIKKWERLSRQSHPFMNRALAIYPPGSIFKVVTLTAALEEKLTRPDEVFYCPGYYKINDRIAKCWKESGHGQIRAEEGLVQSCDIVFYELGRRLGADRLAKYARLYGLGEKSGIDLPQEKRGLVPTEDWKKKAAGEPWYEGDSINFGIGQGFLQVTPLQMAAVYAAVATGKMVKPHVVNRIVQRSGQVAYSYETDGERELPFQRQTLEIICKALKAVVARGTGQAARVEGMPAAGKTGTAQNPGLPHAWFLCFAPADDPQIVISAFVEHGEHGDRTAAGVARQILEWYKSSGSGTDEVLTKTMIFDKI